METKMPITGTSLSSSPLSPQEKEFHKNSPLFKAYEKSLKNGAFRDKVVYGISEHDRSFYLIDPVQKPGALFLGGMGSGKSSAMFFTLGTNVASNSDNTVYIIIDTVKGAADHAVLFDKKDIDCSSNVVAAINDEEKFVHILDLVYNEYLKRREEFSKTSSRNIYEYEKQTKISLARIMVYFEDFYAVPNSDLIKFHLNVDTEGTTANKLKTLMRVGRSYGMTFMFATPRATHDDIPSSLRPGISTYMNFRTNSLGDASAVNLIHAQSIGIEERGRCAIENGFLQFPYLSRELLLSVLKTFYKPLSAKLLGAQFDKYHEVSKKNYNEIYPQNSVLKINPLKSLPTPKKVEEIIKTILKIPTTNDLKNKLYDFYTEISTKELTPGQIISYFLRNSKFFFKTEPEIKDLEVLIIKEGECEPTQEKMNQILSYISLVLHHKLSPTEIDCCSLIILDSFRINKTQKWEAIFNEIKNQLKIVSKGQKDSDNLDSKKNDFFLNLTLTIGNHFKGVNNQFVITNKIYQEVVELDALPQLSALIKSLIDQGFEVSKTEGGELAIKTKASKSCLSLSDFTDQFISELKA